jgi:hypothetical protein
LVKPVPAALTAEDVTRIVIVLIKLLASFYFF